MNYRHSFHAGNFADVHKHVVLLAVLRYMLSKPKPLFYLDAHAGRGSYDLNASEAQRGAEWRSGVAQLVGSELSHVVLKEYLQILQIGSTQPRVYVGSPLLAAAVLRDIDRMVLVEQQDTEAQALAAALQRRRNVTILCDDGYAALKAYLPPKENRGVVLLDPPYEAADEFKRLGQALIFGLERWPSGVFMAWYPLKAEREHERLHAQLSRSGLLRLLVLEFSVRPMDARAGLNGSGLVIANPPWTLADQMQSALTELHALLALDRAGGVRIEWLAGE